MASLDDEGRQLVRAAVYDAYDMVWQLEEMIEAEPDLALLEECIEIMKVGGGRGGRGEGRWGLGEGL